MVFELRPGNDLAEDIRRLGCAQLGQTLSHLAGYPARQKGVHDARKCLKRVRSLLHIARPTIIIWDVTCGKPFSKKPTSSSPIRQRSSRLQPTNSR